MQTITKHYIDGTFVESHGSEVMDIIKPTNGQVIARVTMADEEDTSVPNWYAIPMSPRFLSQGRLTLASRSCSTERKP